MISAAVWLSGNEAKIFRFTPSGVQTHHMQEHAKHGPEGHAHHKHGSDSDKFFKTVVEQLERDPSERWLIVGPGVARTQFQHFVQSHHANLAKKIAGVEAMDKASDGEIKDFAHKFFKHAGVFES